MVLYGLLFYARGGDNLKNSPSLGPWQSSTLARQRRRGGSWGCRPGFRFKKNSKFLDDFACSLTPTYGALGLGTFSRTNEDLIPMPSTTSLSDVLDHFSHAGCNLTSESVRSEGLVPRAAQNPTLRLESSQVFPYSLPT